MICEGDQVVLARAFERDPHFLAPAGLTGEVVIAEPDLISVRMYEQLSGAEAWENEIEWGKGLVDQAGEDLEVAATAGGR
jgi:hypothetical protein